MPGFRLPRIAFLSVAMLAGCAHDARVGGSTTPPVDAGGNTGVPMRGNDGLLNPKPPRLVEWAPDPEFPQKNLRILENSFVPRTVKDKVVTPGSTAFKLGWESSGSPTTMQVFRQTWTLGATNTAEMTQNPVTMVADLGTRPNGYQTWTDTTPAFNTRNCYYIRAGDGTYWSHSPVVCAYAPDPDYPHPVGMATLRLKLSSATTAVTSDNVRVRLNDGVPGATTTPVFTWLDATDTPFRTPGKSATFMLRTQDLRDLSDITTIRVEVPGLDGLCLNELELKIDGTTAYKRTSSTQQCAPGLPFNWAWQSGTINGSSAEVTFAELRNNSAWKNFNPPVIVDDATFVGFSPEEFKLKLDSTTGHALKDDGSATGSSRQLRNGTNDRTTVTWVNQLKLRVQQHMRLVHGTCSVDAHPTFTLNIRPVNANGDAYDGYNGPIEATDIVSELESSGIDQNGPCQLIPGVNVYIQLRALGEFGRQFSGIGGTAAGKPKDGWQFCFPGGGVTGLKTGAENGGFTLCPTSHILPK